MLKKKSIETLNAALANPKISQTDAYLSTHKTTNRRTANDLAAKLFKKPEAQIYLQRHVDKARWTMVKLMETGKEEIKLNASKDILDREYGKATQRTESASTVVSLNLTLADVAQD